MLYLLHWLNPWLIPNIICEASFSCYFTAVSCKKPLQKEKFSWKIWKKVSYMSFNFCILISLFLFFRSIYSFVYFVAENTRYFVCYLEDSMGSNKIIAAVQGKHFNDENHFVLFCFFPYTNKLLIFICFRIIKTVSK